MLIHIHNGGVIVGHRHILTVRAWLDAGYHTVDIKESLQKR